MLKFFFSFEIVITLLTMIKTEAPACANHSVVLDRLEASVNSTLILLSDVKKFRNITKLRAQLDPLFSGTSIAAQGATATEKEIVNFLINEALISQQFPKTDSEVEQEINSIQNNNQLDRTALKAALGHEGFKYSDYFELIRNSSSKRDLIDRDIRTKVSISDDDIKNSFFNHYAKNTSIPRAFHIKMISISTASYKTISAASERASEALREIRAGEAFEEIAKRISDDSSASSGGDLGTLTEDQISATIREQVKKLKVGEVSTVLGGVSLGRYYILKLIDIKSSETDHLDKVKEEIRTRLAAEEYQHQINLWLDRQKQSAFIHQAGEPSIKELPTTP